MEQHSLFDSEIAEEAVAAMTPFRQAVTRYRLALVKEGETPYVGRNCGRPAAVASLVSEIAAELCEPEPREVMLAFYVDVRNRLIGYQQAYAGTLSRCAVEPRLILQMALVANASACVLVHNHPSGDPSPSLEDLAFTRRLAEAGEAVGVRLIDHLIIGDGGRWVSLKDRGSF